MVVCWPDWLTKKQKPVLQKMQDKSSNRVLRQAGGGATWKKASARFQHLLRASPCSLQLSQVRKTPSKINSLSTHYFSYELASISIIRVRDEKLTLTELKWIFSGSVIGKSSRVETTVMRCLKIGTPFEKCDFVVQTTQNVLTDLDAGTDCYSLVGPLSNMQFLVERNVITQNMTILLTSKARVLFVTMSCFL